MKFKLILIAMMAAATVHAQTCTGLQLKKARLCWLLVLSLANEALAKLILDHLIDHRFVLACNEVG
jgi:hypothetical protein